MWTPAVFASATLRDLFDGLEGWLEANGGRKQVTRDELDMLKAQYPD